MNPTYLSGNCPSIDFEAGSGRLWQVVTIGRKSFAQRVTNRRGSVTLGR